jgi:hypothetical protein
MSKQMDHTFFETLEQVALGCFASTLVLVILFCLLSKYSMLYIR